MDQGVQIPPKLLSSIFQAKEEIDKAATIRVISHYDADGISAAAILCAVLHRAGKSFQISMVKGLTDEIIAASDDAELLVLSDMGSANLEALEKLHCRVVVLDHHKPLRDSEKVIHVNPHLSGIDGMTSACGASVCMLLAVNTEERNWDLLPIAFGGIAGDRQTIKGLSGINLWLFEEGLKRGLIEAIPGSLIPPGKLVDALTASTEPYVIGFSGDQEAVKTFLAEAGVPAEQDSLKLNEELRMKLSSLLALKLIAQGTALETMEEVVRDRYYFKAVNLEAETMASLLNACGRSGQESMGVALALGDPSAMTAAQELRNEYNFTVISSLNELVSTGITKLNHLQYFHNDKSGLSGILCGITMQYFGDPDKATIAFSESEDKIKISSRGTFPLLESGVDLAEALRLVAAEVGGFGGGHRIAAGATIPLGEEQRFLELLDAKLAEQKQLKSAETSAT
ncbi:DHHA1 domain-containing protein [Candidatus Methanomassiliicoccus intestinalis]|uniref:DHHA1 domain-containing protein n=1 Tax=Candidatus Methanomassiliicoccus intestinalis TaxID=1406512 RepID=UPI0037DC74AE